MRMMQGAERLLPFLDRLEMAERINDRDAIAEYAIEEYKNIENLFREYIDHSRYTYGTMISEMHAQSRRAQSVYYSLFFYGGSGYESHLRELKRNYRNFNRDILTLHQLQDFKREYGIESVWRALFSHEITGNF